MLTIIYLKQIFIDDKTVFIFINVHIDLWWYILNIYIYISSQYCGAKIWNIIKCVFYLLLLWFSIIYNNNKCVIPTNSR